MQPVNHRYSETFGNYHLKFIFFRNNGEPKAAMIKKSAAADNEGAKPVAARKKSNRKKN